MNNSPRAHVYVMHTYGSLMDLKLRCISAPRIDNRDFLYLRGMFVDEINFKDSLLTRYNEAALVNLGLEFWLPDPKIHHIYTSGETEVRDHYYWLHTPRTNQHRRFYQRNFLTHTIRLEDALKYPFTDDRQRAIGLLMDKVNDLNRSYL